MKIAIYARKSRMTDQGESIDNQIALCRQYALLHFEEAIFDEYKDEGYSGSNTNRPAFLELLKRLKKGQYNILMCYRLDRISRNVLDFSATLDMLTRNNIAFVSIKENFDTTTPMGRAMLHISSVFAQLERETIAERIRDNMLELSKTGRWLGGTVPLGYQTKKIAYEGNNSKVKHYTILEVNPLFASTIRLIFKKYLELGSLSQLENYLMQEEMRTINNKYYHPHVLKNILSNPVYCAADKAFYDYFYHLGARIVPSEEHFTGDYGPMVYNKNRRGKSVYQNDISEWIVALGKHQPLISSSSWLNVQKLLLKNKNKAIPISYSPGHALLSGLVYCEKCGAPMKITNQYVLKDGTPSYTYRCTTKLKSHGRLCNIQNARGHVLDRTIIERIKQVIPQRKDWTIKLSKAYLTSSCCEKETEKEILALESHIKENKKAVSKLIRLVAVTEDAEIERGYQKEIERLHKEQLNLKARLAELQTSEVQNGGRGYDLEGIIENLHAFEKRMDEASVNEKRLLLQSIIYKITWNGNGVSVYLYQSKEDLEENKRNFRQGRKITDEKQ